MLLTEVKFSTLQSDYSSNRNRCQYFLVRSLPSFLSPEDQWVYNIIYNSLAEPSQDSSIRTGGFVFLFHEANGTPNCFPRNGKFIFLRLRALSSATGETGVAYSKINWIPSAMISPSILNIRQHFLLSWI